MVELSTGAATAVAAGGGALVLLLAASLAYSMRRWRAAYRRLAAVASRLDTPGAPSADDRDVVGRVERLAQGAVLRLSDTDARADRLAGALAAVGAGVVVCDDAGHVVHDGAGDVAGGDGPVADAIRDVLAAAVGGRPAERTVDLVGPPPRSLRVTGRPVDDGRRVVGGVALVDDVTERRRFDVVRREFLANVTAELKAPLGALGLLAGTIVAEDDPALTRRLAARLEADALRVGRLVDDLVELSQLESQALPAREPVSVHLVVAQAVERAAGAADRGAVSVDASRAAPGAAVVGDRRQLVSAIGHLVENAVMAGGDVRVAVSAAGPWVEVVVSDDGPGIAADELGRVFEAFYRTGADRERSPGGSGLGLAIASGVAAAAGGELVVSSDAGKGSTFTLRLPAAAAGPDAGRAAPVGEREAG